MNKNFIALVLFSFTVCFISSSFAEDVADRADFQEWIQKNNQAHIPPPPFMQNSKTIVRKKTVKKSPTMVYVNGSGDEVLTPPMSFEENQKVMLDSAPKPTVPPSPESDAAFEGLVQQNVPLTPQQVVKLRQQVDVQQRAAAIPANIPPKPVSSTLIINLAPGTTPPAIRLSQGYISSLVFVDSTGSPWPIASFDIGDPRKLGAPQWDGKSNVLLLQAVSPYGDSDLIIRLVGLPTPITMSLVFGQRVVDYRTDIHVPGIGPNATALPTGTGLPNSANQLLLSVLDGVAPAGSKQLTVRGGDGQAWVLGDKMYLRTRFAVLSPGWIGRMVSPDGMQAFEIQRSSSVLISQYGNPVELKIEGF